MPADTNRFMLPLRLLLDAHDAGWKVGCTSSEGVEKFGHYDPGSSWHAATIDDQDGKFRATRVTVGKKG